MLFDLDQRLMRERGAGTRFISGSALAGLGVRELDTYVRRFATGQTQDCWVYVNGVIDSLPLWTISAKDLEFVELYYPPVTARATVTSIGGHKGMAAPKISLRPAATPKCGNLALVVWFKK